MEEEKDLHRVQLFDGTNYPTWKYRMEVVLEEHDLLDFIKTEVQERQELVIKEQDKPEEKAQKKKELEKEKKRERKCKSLIVARISDSQIEYVQGHATPKAIWNALSRVFERKSVAKRMHLSRQLKELRYEGGPLQQHFLRYESLVRQLRGIGAVLEDVDVVCGLLLSLGDQYATVVTTMESLPEETLTLEFAKCRLLDQEIKQGSVGGASGVLKREPAAFASGSQGKFAGKEKKIKCFYCQKIGHKASVCPEKKDKEKKKSATAHFSEERKGVCFVSVGNASTIKKIQ